MKISPQLGFDSRIVQPVAIRYTDWAIQDHNEKYKDIIISEKYLYIQWKLS